MRFLARTKSSDCEANVTQKYFEIKKYVVRDISIMILPERIRNKIGSSEANDTERGVGGCGADGIL